MTNSDHLEPSETSFSGAEAMKAALGGLDQAEINAEIGIDGALENAKPYFTNLISQLKDPLREGRYDSILGDDVTGRIPALIVGEVANHLSDAQQHPHPARLFYAGGSAGTPTVAEAVKLAMELELEPQYTDTGMRKVVGPNRQERNQYRDQQLDAYIGQIAPQLGERTLIVTDYISVGRTIDRVAPMLHRHGVAFDVATLGTHGALQDIIDARAQQAEFANVNWYSGGDTSAVGVLYSRNDELDENLLRQQIGTEKDYLQSTAKRSPEFSAAKIGYARDRIALFSKSLIDAN